MDPAAGVPQGIEAPRSSQVDSEVLSPRSSLIKDLDDIYQMAEGIKLDKLPTNPADAAKQIEALTTKLDTLAAARVEDQTMTAEGRQRWMEVAEFLKGIALESIESVLSRSENVESLVDKAEELRNEAEQYRQPKLLNCLCLSPIWELIKGMFS